MSGKYVSEILDVCGVTKRTVGIWLLVSCGVFLDGFDYQLVSYTMSQIAADWQLDSVLTGSLTSWSLMGLMLGSVLFGILSDRAGRKKTLCLALVWFSCFTFPAAFAPNYAMFAAMRFCAGVGLGGFLPVCTAIISEFVPTNKRAFFVCCNGCFSTCGWVVAGLVASNFIPLWGWRSCYLVAAVGLLCAAALFFLLPETPFWLVAHGRKKEAAAVLQRIVNSSKHVDCQGLAVTADMLLVGSKPSREGLRSLLTKKMRSTTIGLWLLYFFASFVIFGLNAWLPTLLLEKGFALREAYGFAMTQNACAVVANVLVGVLLERVGRKKGILVECGATIVAIVVMSIVGGGTVPILIACVLLGLSMNTLIPSTLPICSESYPTESRNTGLSWMETVGRLAGVTSPLVLGYLVSTGFGFSTIFQFYIIPAVLLGVSVIVFFKKETRGTCLDRLEDED